MAIGGVWMTVRWKWLRVRHEIRYCICVTGNENLLFGRREDGESTMDEVRRDSSSNSFDDDDDDQFCSEER